MLTGERGGYYGSIAILWDGLRGIDDGELDHTDVVEIIKEINANIEMIGIFEVGAEKGTGAR